MRIFISHPVEARNYAERAKAVFESHSFQTWVWHHDRSVRGDLDLELYRAVEQCDYFAHICTRQTRRSEGQLIERVFAKLHGKGPIVLMVFKPGFHLLVKPDFVPRDVSNRTMYEPVSPKTFDDDCARIAKRLLAEQNLSAEPVSESDRALVTISVTLHDQAHGTDVPKVEVGKPE